MSEATSTSLKKTISKENIPVNNSTLGEKRDKD